MGAIEQFRQVCALGALQSVVAIPRAVPVLHAGPGCGAKLWNALATYNAYHGSGYTGGHSIPCTNSCENEVIFGGEAKLREVICHSFEVMDSDLFVVLTGCTADIVGDDVGGVVREFQNEKRPIVYAETAGFKGSNYLGHELILRAIIEQYLQPADAIEPGLVNIWSVLPYQDPFWEGSMEALIDLVASIGLQPNVIFGLHGGIDALKRVPSAQFNLLVSPWVGLDTVMESQSRSTQTESRIEARETCRALYDVLGNISEKKYVVFALYELEGMSLEEIASTLDIGVNTVKSRLFHARQEVFEAARDKGVLPSHALQVIK